MPTRRSNPLLSDISLPLPHLSPPNFSSIRSTQILVLNRDEKVSKDLKEELNDSALIQSISLAKYTAPEPNHHVSQMPASLWKTSYKIKWFHRATRLRNVTFQKSDSLFCPENYVQIWCDRKAWLYNIHFRLCYTALCEQPYAKLLIMNPNPNLQWDFFNGDGKRKIRRGFDFMNCQWPGCYFENIKSRNS